MESAFELDGISKSFAGVHALKDVKFDVRAGEVHALLGENGAGKSTLIKIMSGVHRPDSGSMTLDGKAVRFASPREAPAAGIATIYQELLLFPELTVAENVFMGHAPRKAGAARLGSDAGAGAGAPRRARQPRPRRRRSCRHPLGGKSAARRDRQGAVAECARADHGRADRGADRERRAAAARRRALRLQARGVGIVYISHRMEEIFEIADRVTVLRDGAYVATRKIGEVDRGRRSSP